jgi:hypothetical protein
MEMSEYKNPLESIPPLTREEFFALPDDIGGCLMKRLGCILWSNAYDSWKLTKSDGEWAKREYCPINEWKDKTNYFYGYITKWREERDLIREGDPKQQASTEKTPLQLIPV